MGVLMLIFALSGSGEAAMTAFPFRTMEQCEATRAEAIKAIMAEPGGATAYIAVACVRPVKLQEI